MVNVHVQYESMTVLFSGHFLLLQVTVTVILRKMECLYKEHTDKD